MSQPRWWDSPFRVFQTNIREIDAGILVTPDGTPVVGATRYGNLWLNTGHGTLGWTMACGSASVLADLARR